MQKLQGEQAGATWSVFVRQYRQRYGLKQEALAALVGVRQPTVARWEAGEAMPALHRRAGILNAMREHAALHEQGLIAGPPVAPEPIIAPDTLRALVRTQDPASLLSSGFIMVDASESVHRGFALRGETPIGVDISGFQTPGFEAVIKTLGRDLLRPGSDLLSVSFDDDSVLIDGKRLRRTWTAMEVAGERFIFNIDRFYNDPEESTGLNLSILTRDDL